MSDREVAGAAPRRAAPRRVAAMLYVLFLLLLLLSIIASLERIARTYNSYTITVTKLNFNYVFIFEFHLLKNKSFMRYALTVRLLFFLLSHSK